MPEILVPDCLHSADHTLTVPLGFAASKFRVLYTKGQVRLLHILSGIMSDPYSQQDRTMSSCNFPALPQLKGSEPTTFLQEDYFTPDAVGITILLHCNMCLFCTAKASSHNSSKNC